ncbi:MAG: hypothetical protein VKJ06_09415 [Vampirovibrionales bacterium]|nr:hypothetical protein [Vampirovibrionales bacterium]
MTDYNQRKSLPSLELDVALYQHYLDDSNLTDKQKLELLQTLWTVITEFIFLGFGVSSTQLIQDRCGQSEELSTENVKTHPVEVDSVSQGEAFRPIAIPPQPQAIQPK